VSEPEVCFINIGPKQRRLRMVSGVAILGVTVGLIAAAALTEAPLWMRLGIFLPAVVGMIGVLQAREKT